MSEEIQRKKAALFTIRDDRMSLEAKNSHSDQQFRSVKADLERANAKFERATEQIKSIKLRLDNNLMNIKDPLECECKEFQFAYNENVSTDCWIRQQRAQAERQPREKHRRNDKQIVKVETRRKILDSKLVRRSLEPL
jgi:hypothetical protein